VIVAFRVGNANANDYLIEEGRLAERNACAAEVIADVKRQLVNSRLDLILGEKRRIGSPSGVGRGSGQTLQLVSTNETNFHENASGRNTPRRVEDMSR